MFFKIKVKTAASRGGSKRKPLPRTPSGRLSRSYARHRQEPGSVVYIGPTVYFVRMGDGNVVKVGHSRLPRYRFDGLKSSDGVSCYLLASIGFVRLEDAQTIEKNIHSLLKKRGRHIRGERFMLSPADVGEVVDTIERLMPDRIERVERVEDFLREALDKFEILRDR